MSSKSEAIRRGSLKVLYDLEFAPVTFDFTTYLTLCECVRQLEGFDTLSITILASEFRRISSKDHSVGRQEKEWRAKSVILDSCDLLPTVANACLFRDPDLTKSNSYHLPPNYQAIVAGQARYTYTLKDLLPLHNLGATVRCLKSSTHARHLVDNVVDGKYITLTLRTSNHSVLRNIDLEEWYKFYCHLVGLGHKVYVIPDFEDMFSDREFNRYGWEVFPSASIDQRIRLALYEGALMNFAPSGGGSAMMVYSDAPYAIFDLINEVFDLQKLIKQGLGLQQGESCPWATASQKFYWEKSTFDYLVSVYNGIFGSTRSI